MAPVGVGSPAGRPESSGSRWWPGPRPAQSGTRLGCIRTGAAAIGRRGS